ncbi:hypothetical protein AOQ73_18230 [Bradyrhizobium pachyrhizi]|uniref:hypothetical protein n=1 Tax=Bradyrhizobium pachyrhizi TaxID=280333 RepID=UPI000704A465|nr:hypothetical protein [Bradyrhizobium pachyrhizi]KRQ01293.1 hypothetical protein AOQ73_18230 [Bradyrhizobium pachyrhizi]
MLPVSRTASVTNIEAGHRQLRTAIDLFFREGDAVSVHTLAAAAREIFEKHCEKQGLGGLFDFPTHAPAVVDLRQAWTVMNAARNFFKHPADRVEDSIPFDDSENDAQIYIACTDCITLSPAGHPVEAGAFLLWSISSANIEWTGEGLPPDDAAKVRAVMTEMDERLPGLRKAARADKKRWGLGLLEHVRSRPGSHFEQIGTLMRQYRQEQLAAARQPRIGN